MYVASLKSIRFCAAIFYYDLFKGQFTPKTVMLNNQIIFDDNDTELESL